MALDGLRIRKATGADRDEVLAFCQHTWDWGDYIPEVWDTWLADAKGRLLVGEMDGRIVAVGYARLVTRAEAWLQGMRVHPDYRARRIALRFTERATKAAFELGAEVARLATLATNHAIQRVMDDLGYRRAATFVSLQVPVAPLRPAAAEVLAEQHLSEVQDFLARSPGFAAMGGLECSDWVCYRLTPDRLRARLAAGGVVAKRAGGKIAALAFLGRGRNHGAVVEFADGERESLIQLAEALVDRATGEGLEILPLRMPDVPYILAAFDQAGLGGEQRGRFLIYEKHIGKQ